MRLCVTSCLNLQVTCVSNIEKNLQSGTLSASGVPHFISKTGQTVHCALKIFLHVC